MSTSLVSGLARKIAPMGGTMRMRRSFSPRFALRVGVFAEDSFDFVEGVNR
jgi:hypothetical protein